MANVLIIGKRGRCYRAAIKLGHSTFLWSEETLHESRKKKLSGWIESRFAECAIGLTSSIKETIRGFSLDFVVAATESSVDVAALVRKEFGLAGTPLEITNILHNKNDMKFAAEKLDIPITKFHLIAQNDTAEELIEKLGLPLVIKPVAESGARGVVVLNTIEEIRENMKPGLLAEMFVDGTEVSVETFIYNGEPIFHNITDYLHQWKKSILPAALDSALAGEILSINDRVIKGFEVQNGMTHSEFYLSKNGPVFGEMAVRPPGGYYMELIEKAYGFDPWEVYVQLETGGVPPALPTTAKKQACVLMVHPGAGTVEEVTGLEKIRDIAEIDQFKFRIEPGSIVNEHVSTSSESGHILMSSNSRDILLERLSYIERNLNIKMKTI